MAGKGVFAHPVMFHHFHGSVHPKVQGSISGDDFEEMLDWLSREHHILDASEYIFRFENDTLKNSDICLTFDDALLCQADIAAPILDKRNIKAFFFIYSSPLCGDPDPFEIYRYFRTTAFSNIDDFYKDFFLQVQNLHPRPYENALRKYDENSYLSEFSFYTKNDRWFRFLRDQALDKSTYEELMNQLMINHKFDKNAASKKLWMSNKTIQYLHNNGHIIGLHSYSHPFTFHTLTKAQQEIEYEKNFDHLRSTLKSDPITMSHPYGKYNDYTLKILRRFGIRVGFLSHGSITHINSNLEIPRNDHANVYREMKK